MFRGREFDLNFCLIPKENICISSTFPFAVMCYHIIAKENILEIQMFSFGVMQKFRSNSQPLKNGLEKSDLNDFNVEWSQLFKKVRNLNIGHILSKWATLQTMRYYCRAGNTSILILRCTLDRHKLLQNNCWNII